MAACSAAAAANCARLRLRYMSPVLKSEGSVRSLSTNLRLSWQECRQLQKYSLPSVNNIADRLQNQLKFPKNVIVKNQIECAQERILDQAITKEIFIPGMSVNIVQETPEQGVNDFQLPGLSSSIGDDLINDDEVFQEKSLILSSVLKKRRKKMNKHKYKKRIHRDKAKIRTVKYFRLRRKKRKLAHLKRVLKLKIKKILGRHPKSDYPNRPYVVYRLRNW